MFRFLKLKGRITLFVFMIMVLSGITTTLFAIFIINFSVLPDAFFATIWYPILTLVISAIIGSYLANIFSRYVLAPINSLGKAIKLVAKGNFDVTIKEKAGFGEINELIGDFNLMVEELKSIEIFRSDFIDNFSHEFKTPIVSIRGFARQLEKDNLSEEKKKRYISIIAEESEKLSNMASNVLLLSKLQNQKIITNMQNYYLDEQLRNTVILFEKEWTKKGISIVTDLDRVLFYANKEITEHIWINIISNAIKFTDDGGEIMVSLSNPGDHVTVKIRDNGVGMTKKTLENIFEKFYQEDSAHSIEGNGLGLSLVKRIVQLSGGSITVESDLGKGTTFIVELPNKTN